MPPSSTIHVCQSSTCRGKGSEAVLVEIEELVSLIDNNLNCNVEPTGCLGYCSRGPAVAVVTPTNEHANRSNGSKSRTGRKTQKISNTSIHVHINTFEKSAEVVKQATGADPDLHDLPIAMERRLSKIRKTRAREYAVSTYQWNRALKGLQEDAVENEDLREDLRAILTSAGYPPHNLLPLLLNAKGWRDVNYTVMPASIESYVPWTLNSVEIVSSHSAIFELTTRDLSRNTPHPRGRGRLASPITWHVTMLGEVGSNNEGPLPWIERDYTPISSALDWERGRVAILIKIYNMGRLTSWLRRTRMIGNKENEKKQDEGDDTTGKGSNIIQTKQNIWLSAPLKTLSMPNLVPDKGDGFKPSSVLLLLAGTGIVALPQILAHREPSRLLGIPTPRSKQLQCPIDLILSCRDDDLLMLEEINDWCKQGRRLDPRRFCGLRHCTLLITHNNEEKHAPFPEFQAGPNRDLILQELEENNVTIRSHRLNNNMISESIGRMVEPCRVVVSGPDSFNQSARELLEECGFATSTRLTVLSA